MKITTAILFMLGFLMAGPLWAQVSGDPFDEFHASLIRAAARHADEIRSGGRADRVAHEATWSELRWEAGVADHISNPGMRRMQQLHPVLAEIFRAEGVPQEFLLVGLIESGYHSDAVSPAQAVGMWQFVPATARRFDLINELGDFRTDIVRSTRAAAQYLRSLLDQFQDWRLALAAYNAGEDRVEAALRKARSRDFSELSRLNLLPVETIQYVPAVLQAMGQARNHGLLDSARGIPR